MVSPAANRIVVLGNGASGKSRFARQLAATTGIKRVELDAIFWSDDLTAQSVEEWRRTQGLLVGGERWILDGDLGPYDALDVRLGRADTVVLFDVPTRVCAWRALRRSREGLDFWKWLLAWRSRYRPRILEAIDVHAPDAYRVVIRTKKDRDRAIADLTQRAHVE